MENCITIVLDDSDLVSGVCGSNDGNLLAIEGILGKPVFVRGNELRAEDLSFIEAERFRGMVDALILAVREGESPTPEYVRSFANLSESHSAKEQKISCSLYNCESLKMA